MYSFLSGLLSDKKGTEVFTVFGAWHFFYLGLIILTVALVLFFMRNKDATAKSKATRVFICIALGLYAADFFLMPLAYGEIDIEKLPFHACTSMCVLCFLSYYNRFLEKYRRSFVLLSFISNFCYIVYPAGVMWYQLEPTSYRVVQTLLFHSIMTIYGLLTFIYEYDKFDIKKCYRDLSVVVCMTVWALIGSYAYSGTSEGYSRSFNWFFVVRDPFNALPEAISPFIMPFFNIVFFFGVEMLIHTVILIVQRVKAKK